MHIDIYILKTNRYTYHKENIGQTNAKRQAKGGGNMVWGMMTSNGILSIQILYGRIWSQDYHHML